MSVATTDRNCYDLRVHTDEIKNRKGSPETGDPTKKAIETVRLELMRYPNIRKLKSERLDTLAMDILIALNAKGALSLNLGKSSRRHDDTEPAPERKLRPKIGPARG